jgi:hypothetical protein
MIYLDDEDPELYSTNSFDIGDTGIVAIDINANSATTNTDIQLQGATMQILK